MKAPVRLEGLMSICLKLKQMTTSCDSHAQGALDNVVPSLAGILLAG